MGVLGGTAHESLFYDAWLEQEPRESAGVGFVRIYHSYFDVSSVDVTDTGNQFYGGAVLMPC
jgi:hypothetical protein